jgi:hypothetical protein
LQHRVLHFLRYRWRAAFAAITDVKPAASQQFLLSVTQLTSC